MTSRGDSPTRPSPIRAQTGLSRAAFRDWLPWGSWLLLVLGLGASPAFAQPAQLQWQAAPSTAVIDTALSPTPQVQVQDSGGAPDSTPVSVTIRAVPAAQRLTISGRHFVDPQGRAVLLTGSHSDDNLIDFYYGGLAYDVEAVWRRMELGWDSPVLGAYQPRQNHMRMWMWEGWDPVSGEVSMMPFYKDGGGTDGRDLPERWDLSTTANCAPMTASSPVRFQQAFFDRVATRVAQARDRGIYVTVMLFQGWDMIEIGWAPSTWYYPTYNCNGINGQDQGTPAGIEIATGTDPVIQHIQEEYVTKMIDTLYTFDNVLWEIGNELPNESLAWQEAWVTFIKNYETSKGGIRHLVGISSLASGGPAASVNADWISPGALGNVDPPAVSNLKPTLYDTDHNSGAYADDYSNPLTIMVGFFRGYHPIYFDGHPHPIWSDTAEDALRRGQAVLWTLAQRLNLLTLTPQNGTTSPADTGFALVNATTPPYQYAVYQSDGADRSITLTGIPSATYEVRWINLDTFEYSTPPPSNVTNPGSGFTTPAANTNGWILTLRDITSATEFTLAGTTTRTSSGALASYPSVTLPRLGHAHLFATSDGLTPDTTAAFPITEAPAAPTGDPRAARPPLRPGF